MARERNFVRDVEIDTDIEMLIPDNYINSIQERLNLYTELDQIANEEDLQKFSDKLTDRFGKLPRQIKELFAGLRLRWACKRLGFERLILKSRKLRCYFISNPQSPFFETPLFQNLLQYVATKGPSAGLSFKKSTKHFMLIKDDVRDLRSAKKVLEELREAIAAEVEA